MATEEVIAKARASLERVQTLDPKSIARRSDLGKLDFSEAVPDAQRVVEMFQRINTNTLSIFSDGILSGHIQGHADSAYNLLKRLLDFDPQTAGNAAEERRNLINELRGVAENYPDALSPQISFSVVSSLDPTTTQQEMRAIIQRFSDERDNALAGIEKLKDEAEAVLSRVRDAAAEQGVSQQASYFKTVADEHDASAQTWLGYSLWAGGGTLIFALISSVSYRITWLAPVNTLEAAQLITSKLVILSILVYGVVVCVRNFLSHKHNSVVNRHRQNALLTYTAFVDAAPTEASREVVLTHAAASVFSPQETGYVRNEEPASGKSIMEILTKAPLSDRPH